MTLENDDRTDELLARADRALDQAPADEQRERPPLDPTGTARALIAERHACAAKHRRAP